MTHPSEAEVIMLMDAARRKAGRTGSRFVLQDWKLRGWGFSRVQIRRLTALADGEEAKR